MLKIIFDGLHLARGSFHAGQTGRGMQTGFVLFPRRLGRLRQRGAIAAPRFPWLIPCHEFLLGGTRQCAFGWQVYLIRFKNFSHPRHLHLSGSKKEVTSGVLYAALAQWCLKGTVKTPSRASLAPVFLNKTVALGWISVKANIVLIKLLQEVGLVWVCFFFTANTH